MTPGGATTAAGPSTSPTPFVKRGLGPSALQPKGLVKPLVKVRLDFPLGEAAARRTSSMCRVSRSGAGASP